MISQPPFDLRLGVSAMEQRAAERARLKEEREEKKRKMEEEKVVSYRE